MWEYNSDGRLIRRKDAAACKLIAAAQGSDPEVRTSHSGHCAQVAGLRSKPIGHIQTGAKQLCKYHARHWKADTLLLKKNLFVSTSVNRKKRALNGSQSRTTRFRGEHEDTERELNGL